MDNKIHKLMFSIQKLNKTIGVFVPIDELKKDSGLNDKELKHFLNKLKKSHSIIEPKKGYIMKF